MVVTCCAPPPRIPQFYAGRAIFITGATGFMGKVLLERLLTTCPDVGKLYLLLRDKAGTKSQDRLLALKRCQVFDVLRERAPAQLDKLRIVSGDITKPGLGISAEDLAVLEEVSVVFNCAATVRFHEPLRLAAENNVLSVIRLMKLCDRLPRIQSFVHVSTAYCNAEHSSIDERIYPLPNALPRMLADALAVPDDTSDEEIKRIISPKPNTYTYTKMMGETAVEEHTGRTYPAAVFRPSIVVSALKHPVPGWNDNFNGPSGAIAAVSSGFLHVFQSYGSAIADILPVDLAIDTLIAVAWETAIDNLPTVRVYNCSTSENPTTWRSMLAAVVADSRQNPLPDAVWYPACFFTKNKYLYEILKFLVQTVPFHAIEYLRRIFSHKKTRMNLIKIHTRLCAMNDALKFFATREWKFSTERVRRLRARLSSDDRAIFNLDPHSIDWNDHFKNFTRGCRVYVGKHTEDSLPESRKRLHRLYLMHLVVTILLPLLLLYQVLNPALLDRIVHHLLQVATVFLTAIGKASNILARALGTACA